MNGAKLKKVFAWKRKENEMFNIGDFIWCPGDDAHDNYPGWTEDWGIIIKVNEGYNKNKYHIRWLHGDTTHEEEYWAHKYCQLVASAK